MRHLKKGRKFGREVNQRHALMKTMAASFFMAGRIRTTEAKARELRPLVERSLTRGKVATLASRRHLRKFFSERSTARVLAMARTLGSRPGGYTRVIKLGMRRRDAAKMAILEMVK